MKKKILVIEDEENLAKLIQAFLMKNGYRVTSISEVLNGVEDIRKEKPDLIITDLLLPGTHGFDICKNVRTDSELQDTPLIIMTAVYKNAIHKLEAKKLGVKDFVEKPLDFEDLLQKIHKTIGPGETAPEAVTVIAAPPAPPAPPSPATTTAPRPKAADAPMPTSLPESWDGVTRKDTAPVKVPQFDFSDKPTQKSQTVAKIFSDAEKDANIRAHFKELQQNYASKLPAKVIELENIWENIIEGKDTEKQLAKLRRHVHSLTGSGTTFGFDEISENARELELTLDMIISEGIDTIGERKDKIDQLLSNMRRHPVVSTEMEIMRLNKLMK